jgi:hypothetical protein
MPRGPREIAEEVRRMVAGEGVVFADLFAADGVLAYPFAPPGRPRELRGRDAIRSYFGTLGRLGAYAPEGQAVPAAPQAHGRPGADGRHDHPAAGLIGQRPGRR